MGNLKNSRIMVATLTGAAIGAAVSLLYAPRSGRETRSNLRRNAEKASKSLGDSAHDLKGKVFSGMEEGGDELGYLVGSAIAHTARTTKDLLKALEKELVKQQSETKG